MYKEIPIYFNDLNEAKQKELLEEIGVSNASDMNWDMDIVPLTYYPIETEVVLENMFHKFSDEDWDELDAVMYLLENGYTLDDFKYSDDRYLWMEEFMKDHGLL